MTSQDFWVGPFDEPDRYRLVRLLGGGGEGEVWEAVLQLSSEGRSTVAVKIVASREGDEQEFAQTGRLLRMLHHPGLVRVTESFTGPTLHRGGTADSGTRANYVVMDHIEGFTLRDWCDENPEATAAARLKMLRTAASALDAMHSGVATHVPVAHGDVKPTNVIVRSDGGSVLVDLGLTRLTDGGGTLGRSASYAAPELRGEHPVPTPEADRYAFAVTVAQVLIGASVPTTADGWVDLSMLADQLHRSPVTARRPLLVRHVLDAIKAEPEARPRNLQRWLDSASETLSRVTDAPGHLPATGHGTSPHPPAAASAQQHTGVWSTSAAVPVATQHLGPVAAASSPEPRTRRRNALMAAASVLVLLVAAGVFYFALRPDGTSTSNLADLPATTVMPESAAASPTRTPPKALATFYEAPWKCPVSAADVGAAFAVEMAAAPSIYDERAIKMSCTFARPGMMASLQSRNIDLSTSGNVFVDIYESSPPPQNTLETARNIRFGPSVTASFSDLPWLGAGAFERVTTSTQDDSAGISWSWLANNGSVRTVQISFLKEDAGGPSTEKMRQMLTDLLSPPGDVRRQPTVASRVESTSASSATVSMQPPADYGIARMPAAFVGQWSGSITQDGSPHSPYPGTFSIRDGKVGDRVAEGVYPTLNCKVHWTLSGIQGNSIVVQETVDDGPRCHNVTVTLTSEQGGSLGYQFEGGTGRAILHR